MDDIKAEVFETEDVKIENEIIDEEELEAENRLPSLFGIVVDDGILDFHKENVIPEEMITKGEKDVKESIEVHSFAEQNTNYLFPRIKEEEELIENPVSEIIYSKYGPVVQDELNPFQLVYVDQSFNSLNNNNKSTVYSKPVHEKNSLLKEKPYKCLECEYSCSQKSDLVRHVQSVHLKVKPFRCTECEYSCFQKSTLARHIQLIHLKEKPFRCTKCEYSFAQKCHLATHVRSVHLKEKPFKCKECEYSCSRKSDLVKHVQSVHLKEKPFKCAECEHSFSQRSSLLTHIRNVHNYAK